jgi:hypothetical protein
VEPGLGVEGSSTAIDLRAIRTQPVAGFTYPWLAEIDLNLGVTSDTRSFWPMAAVDVRGDVAG